MARSRAGTYWDLVRTVEKLGGSVEEIRVMTGFHYASRFNLAGRVETITCGGDWQHGKPQRAFAAVLRRLLAWHHKVRQTAGEVSVLVSTSGVRLPVKRFDNGLFRYTSGATHLVSAVNRWPRQLRADQTLVELVEADETLLAWDYIVDRGVRLTTPRGSVTQ